MRLISLYVENLYDTLSLNLDFFRDLNLLVGINGSGKTSALNVIDWLLTPNLTKLATQHYNILRLNLEVNGKEYTIIAERSICKVLVKVQCAEDEFPDISIPIDPNDPWRHDEARYKHMSPEEGEKKAWFFLTNLKKPTIVSLQRTITAEVDEEIYYERPERTSRRIRKRPSTPLDHIQKIFNEQYAEYRKAARENDSKLKSRIILTALHSPDSDELSLTRFHMPEQSTEQLEQKVKGYLSASIPLQNVETQVERFFNYFRSLGEEVDQSSEKSGKVMNLIQSQFSRVDELARAFKEFEEENTLAFKRLSEYLRSVNLFLADSGKVIVADDNVGRLAFREMKDGKPDGPNRPINELSSGETQIIILFALMAFEASEKSVFIVDEPELSLHPKWQTDFMKSFLGLRPENTQVFVATHSPEIAAGRKSSCVFF